MHLFLTDFYNANLYIRKFTPDFVFSFIDPGIQTPFDPAKFPDTKCYKFNFYDVEASSPGSPSRDDLRDFIITLRSAEETHSILFHCHHGRSRSTAAFLIALAQSNPGIPDDIIMQHFRDVLPWAEPNIDMIEFADTELKPRRNLWSNLWRFNKPIGAKKPRPLFGRSNRYLTDQDLGQLI